MDLRHHDCPAKKQQRQQQRQQQQPTTIMTTDLSKKIAAIKAQLLVLASRLDRIEAELKK